MGKDKKPDRIYKDALKDSFKEDQADKDWKDRPNKGSVVDKKFGDKK